MKKIAFIGSYDKTDFLLYVAKILTVLGKRVVIIDSTITQKAKYVVPVIKPARTYMSEFEGIDVAVGFSNMNELLQYVGATSEEQAPYDYALLDIDTYIGYCAFDAKQAIKHYFVTSFDIYSLRRGLEALASLQEPLTVTKILFSKDMSKEEDEYLEYLAMGCKINWEKGKVYFPFDRGDQSSIIENQRAAKINFKNLSAQYKDGLIFLVEGILEQEGSIVNEVRKAVRRIEKGA